MLELLQGQIKKIDEFQYVSNVIKLLYSRNAANAKLLVDSLNPIEQSCLKEVMQSKRVTIQRKGVSTTVPRRIIRPKPHLPSGPSGPSGMH